jgi:hypothetical protein
MRGPKLVCVDMWCLERYKLLQIFVLLDKPMLNKCREALELRTAIALVDAHGWCSATGHGLVVLPFRVASYVSNAGT